MNLIREIKESWGWIGIDPVEIVGENEFGNLMIRDVDGNYWRLCPEDVYCEIVARNKEELKSLSRNQEFVEDWKMQALVEAAKGKCGSLPEGKKYHLVIPGVLGGEYAASNINMAPLVELIRFSGDLAAKIKDLPEGSQVKLEVTE